MGEVYRADDLKLGLPVALKFLPDRSVSAATLERLYREVRVGRQVSHPNVCRLYDIGEWNGNHYLAMEYVDGEDLSSLLRRIGKLPGDKALEIARDICLGVAAAHSLGIIHRDLKPANIMIDGRGHARITDFGLALASEDLAGRREIAGTPGYMAPEQLAGGEVTQRSDLYAVGLILYEIFTGKRLFEGDSGVSAASRRAATDSVTSAAARAELDPAVRRVILRCIEENAEARPPSIHSVIAALPGGDPLQAAMDAGETPTPQMVAAAGAVGDLSVRAAWGLALTSVAMLFVLILLFKTTVLFRIVPLPKPPEALIERCQAVVESAGYGEGVRDHAILFFPDTDYFPYALAKNRASKWSELAHLRPGVFAFGYRESPVTLVPAGYDGRVTWDDPPLLTPGMTEVSVDVKGRLVSFVGIPPSLVAEIHPRALDWAKFFDYAGGDLEQLRRGQTRWTAPVDNDAKFAWDGVFRGDATPIHIEAASYRGRPVWFRLSGPWGKGNTAIAPPARSTLTRVVQGAVTIIVMAALTVTFVLARRNLRLGRSDRRTAARLALLLLVAGVIASLFRIDHVADPPTEFWLLQHSAALTLLVAGITWSLYIALEPMLRRRWPHALIGWTRLFAGRFRDPMVGRDVAIGCFAGLTNAVARLAAIEVPGWLGLPAPQPFMQWITPVIATRHQIFTWFSFVVGTASTGFFFMMLMVIALVLFRARPAAIAVVWILITLDDFRATESVPQLIASAVIATVLLALLLRFGVLAVAVADYVYSVALASPFTLSPSDWYFGRSMAAIVFLCTISIVACWLSLGGKAAVSVPFREET
jgi:hypothetical protein